MKKILLIIVIIILVPVIIIILGIYKFNFTNDDIYIQTGGKLNSKDATYIIDNKPVTLNNGIAESEMVAGSASKTTTRYFGNDATGDLNSDGKADVAFLLTQETGGSGTFYYIAVALASVKGYQGLNAILLGDRIAPQTTEISQGKVIVNYADRKIDESFAIKPSVGVSKYFTVIDNKLVEINSISQITGREWKWVSTQLNNKIITPNKLGVFSITFKDGNISGKTDCNSFSGQYKIEDSKLTFSPFSATMMFCENSQESVFEQSLADTESYSFSKENNLILKLKLNKGLMVFN